MTAVCEKIKINCITFSIKLVVHCRFFHEKFWCFETFEITGTRRFSIMKNSKILDLEVLRF